MRGEMILLHVSYTSPPHHTGILFSFSGRQNQQNQKKKRKKKEEDTKIRGTKDVGEYFLI
jgi:hypothetical protein